MVLNSLLVVHGEKWPKPTSQGRPEIEYLLQGGMSGKGSLLAKPSTYLISRENSVLGYVTYVGSGVTCSRLGI